MTSAGCHDDVIPGWPTYVLFDSKKDVTAEASQDVSMTSRRDIPRTSQRNSHRTSVWHPAGTSNVRLQSAPTRRPNESLDIVTDIPLPYLKLVSIIYPIMKIAKTLESSVDNYIFANYKYFCLHTRSTWDKSRRW